MVKVNDIYLVMSTVAVLHEIPEPTNIVIKNFETLLSPPITAVATSPLGTLISSQRDQIEILIANNKTDFRDLSGKTDFSSSNIGKIVDYFINEFKLKVNSYGVNFILRLPNPEPRGWIVENIISSDIISKTGKKLVGGKGTISFKSGRKIYNIAFEEHDGKNIELNFNATEKVGKVPNPEALNNELQKQWIFLLKFLSELGL